MSVAFILVNSIAGILGALSTITALPPELPLFAMAAVSGGLVGAYFGSRSLSAPWLQRLLAAVLVIAGLKMIFT